ncbi:MAG: class IV adenylate cyclase [Planctomycetales bacterium]|nr:class IV adenylate cyclase [Planctomycetales bacterium]
MPANIEIKARLDAYETARAVAQRLAAPQGVLVQVDTYFTCRHGRLKLREIEAESAHLIWYQRPDCRTPSLSQYQLTPAADPQGLKQTLTAALGIQAVVCKARELYLWENVRIHLDRVQGLGEFLEFEAVLGGTISADEGQRQLEFLLDAFAIAPAQLVDCSYLDLVGSR